MGLDWNEIEIDIGELNFTVFGGVVTIDLSYNGNIYGTVYWENFPSTLQALYLDYNDITSIYDCNNASISCGMDNMYNLKYLDMWGSQLSGTINWQMFTNFNNLITLDFGYDTIYTLHVDLKIHLL